MLDKTLKCPICGRPYKFYSMMVGDQSACRTCVAEAERRAMAPTKEEEEIYRLNRRKYFGQSLWSW